MVQQEYNFIFLEKENIIKENMNIINLINKLSDESDNFTFTSYDSNLDPKYFINYLNFLVQAPNSTVLLVKHKESLVGIGILEGGKKEYIIVLLFL